MVVFESGITFWVGCMVEFLCLLLQYGTKEVHLHFYICLSYYDCALLRRDSVF
jgi:hypothetical protein